jgi:membrane associated rhomboid family serine protease
LNWLAAVEHFEVYRFVTYMFIHGGIWHIGMNMLVLYFFGPALERHMGTRKFLWFYFACGLAGGAAFLAYGWAIAELNANVIGASGAALGVLVGYAVLYPNARIIFLIVQMKARTLALIYAAITVLYVLADPAEGGGVAHAAHLGGIVCAWVWFYWVPRWRGTVRRAKLKLQHGAWDRKLKAEADEQAAVDAILDKIRQKGLASLSRAEKKKLKDATRRQQEQDTRRARGNRDTYM